MRPRPQTCPRFALLVGLLALAGCSECDYQENDIERFEFDEFDLDADEPGVEFTVEGCTTGASLTINVVAAPRWTLAGEPGDIDPDGAHPSPASLWMGAEHRGESFSVWSNDPNWDPVSIRFEDVHCNEPLVVTLERLDDELEGTVVVEVFLEGRVPGDLGDTKVFGYD